MRTSRPHPPSPISTERPGPVAESRTGAVASCPAGAFAIVMSVAFVIPSADAFDASSAHQRSGAVQAFAAADATSASTGSMSVALRNAYGVTAPPPMQWPLPPTTPMSSDFGPRSCAGCSSDRDGIDLNAPSGTPIEAMAVVVVVETNPPGYAALGVHARIQHLIDGRMVTSVYAHVQTGSMGLQVGDSVAAGQVLGLRACTGTHVHFEVRPGGGAAIDPAAFLAARVA